MFARKKMQAQLWTVVWPLPSLETDGGVPLLWVRHFRGDSDTLQIFLNDEMVFMRGHVSSNCLKTKIPSTLCSTVEFKVRGHDVAVSLETAPTMSVKMNASSAMHDIEYKCMLDGSEVEVEGKKSYGGGDQGGDALAAVVSIQDTRTKDIDGKVVAQYAIKSGERLVRWTRFSDFDDLLVRCKSCFCYEDPKAVSFPVLPPKTYAAISDKQLSEKAENAAFIDQRKTDLETFLRTFLKMYRGPRIPYLLQFCGLPIGDATVAMRPPQPEPKLLFDYTRTAGGGGGGAEPEPEEAGTQIPFGVAMFGANSSDISAAPCKWADPPTCHPTLKNGADLAGCIVICTRGKITFAEKALAIQEAGAVAAIVVNSTKELHQMQDTEGIARNKIKIPVVLVGSHSAAPAAPAPQRVTLRFADKATVIMGALPEDMQDPLRWRTRAADEDSGAVAVDEDEFV